MEGRISGRGRVTSVWWVPSMPVAVSPSFMAVLAPLTASLADLSIASVAELCICLEKLSVLATMPKEHNVLGTYDS